MYLSMYEFIFLKVLFFIDDDVLIVLLGQVVMEGTWDKGEINIRDALLQAVVWDPDQSSVGNVAGKTRHPTCQ